MVAFLLEYSVVGGLISRYFICFSQHSHWLHLCFVSIRVLVEVFTSYPFSRSVSFSSSVVVGFSWKVRYLVVDPQFSSSSPCGIPSRSPVDSPVDLWYGGLYLCDFSRVPARVGILDRVVVVAVFAC